jgi:hypothetical protein
MTANHPTNCRACKRRPVDPHMALARHKHRNIWNCLSLCSFILLTQVFVKEIRGDKYFPSLFSLFAYTIVSVQYLIKQKSRSTRVNITNEARYKGRNASAVPWLAAFIQQARVVRSYPQRSRFQPTFIEHHNEFVLLLRIELPAESLHGLCCGVV